MRIMLYICVYVLCDRSASTLPAVPFISQAAFKWNFLDSFPDIESRVQDGFQVVNCECTVAMQLTPKGDIND